MYDAIVFGPLIIKYSLLIIIASFLIIFLLFRLISPYDKETIKRDLDRVTDLLLFTILAIIVTKIVLNFQLFLSEPIAVLAYPSDAKDLFFASLVVIVRIVWLVKKKTVIWPTFFDSLTRFLLFSHFISLFGFTIISNEQVLLYQLAIHFMLLIGFIWFGEKTKDQRFIPLTVIIFGFTQAILGIIYPVIFFGYYVGAGYYALIGLIGVQQLYQVYKKRREQQ